MFSKKFFLIIFVFTLIVFIWGRNYFFSEKENILKDKGENQLKDSNPTSLKISHSFSSSEETDEKIFETRDSEFEEFDQIDKVWLKDVQAFLGEINFLKYTEMRTQLEKEKEKSYQAYHDFLRKKYGNNFKYNLSEDQSINEKKWNKLYESRLHKLIGDKSFIKYLQMRQSFNERLLRESNGRSVLLIEF